MDLIPSCDMKKDCSNPVTHIGEKGYAYCTAHAVTRRQSGYERTRKMRAWELKLLREGKPLPSYKPIPKPKPEPHAGSAQNQLDWLNGKYEPRRAK